MTHEEIDLLAEYPNQPTLEDFPLLEGETPEEQQLRLDAALAEGLAAYKLAQHALLDEFIALKALNEKKAEQSARIEAHFQVDGGLPWRFGIFDDSNPLKQMNDMLGTDELTAKLDLLDTAKDAWVAQANIKKIRTDKIKAGAAIDARCVDAYNFVTGSNIGKTIQEIDDMERDFAQIQKALKAGRPDKAAGLIQAISAPEYAELKTELLAILSGA